MRGTPVRHAAADTAVAVAVCRAPPPFGTLVAIDLRTGPACGNRHSARLPALVGPDMAAKARARLGLPNLGGPIVTAGGVVFIAATLDRALHAFDIETGRELWRGALPASGKATPMSYRLASGEQYVVVTAGGGDVWGKGDHVVAFRLRAERSIAPGAGFRVPSRAFVAILLIDGERRFRSTTSRVSAPPAR